MNRNHWLTANVNADPVCVWRYCNIATMLAYEKSLSGRLTVLSARAPYSAGVLFPGSPLQPNASIMQSITFLSRESRHSSCHVERRLPRNRRCRLLPPIRVLLFVVVELQLRRYTLLDGRTVSCHRRNPWNSTCSPPYHDRGTLCCTTVFGLKSQVGG
jgi:hypothetical protein